MTIKDKSWQKVLLKNIMDVGILKKPKQEMKCQ